jgi:cytochrome c553
MSDSLSVMHLRRIGKVDRQVAADIPARSFIGEENCDARKLARRPQRKGETPDGRESALLSQEVRCIKLRAPDGHRTEFSSRPSDLHAHQSSMHPDLSPLSEGLVTRLLSGIVFILSALLLQQAAAQNATRADLPKPANTMEERLRACVSCHGQSGRGISNVYFPRLAGKPAGYLYNQLLAFREGRRKYAPMNYLLAYLPDEYLQQMAQYYAAIQIPYDNPSPTNATQEVLQHGRQLVTKGDPARQIPACAACHGPNLGGREPGIPALLGLRADYISAQLGAWRYGTRTALEPDCMQLVAARLSEADVTAVAAFLSSMPIPANTRPIAHSTERLPLACGSQKP